MAHEHTHEHEHEHSLRHQLAVIGGTAVLLAAAMVVEHHTTLSTWQLLLVYLLPYLLAGHETLEEAFEGIVHGDWFNEHFLMTVATAGALAIGFLPGAEPQMAEAVFVMLFFQVGELFEGYAEGKSRQGIAHLMEMRPDTATIEEKDGEGRTCEKTVSPDMVAVGQTVVVRPGEKVPLDGVITDGSTTLNTMALTGESMPRQADEGDEVLSGCINLTGVIRLRVTKVFGESTFSKIIHLVEDAGEHKSKSEAFITRFARIYTPVVVVLALLIAIIPPVVASLTGQQPFSMAFTTWAYRALLFLVVSCPCALVISVPLTFFGGIGGASRHGILIKGANYIDVLAQTGTVVFDKTGTLTEGQFAVSAVHPESYDERQLLHLAAHVEHFSQHPIGAALRAAFPEEGTDGCEVSQVEEVAGRGIRACVGGKTVCVGNTKMMDDIGVRWHDCTHSGTIIHVAIDGTYAGHIVINDRIKDDSLEAINGLRRQGVSRTVMLSGDRQEVVQHVATQLGIDTWQAELLPAGKVEYMKQLKSPLDRRALATSGTQETSNLKSQTSNLKSQIAFVGDGINDAPVLALADVGIAMGAMGSDAAIDAADVVLMDDRPSRLPMAIAIARRTLHIARQNIALAIGIKVAVLLLAVMGLATMWMAVFADVGVTVLAVFNAMRALSTVSAAEGRA